MAVGWYPMLDLCRLIFGIASDLLRSQVALEAEILVLRQQINVLRRANPQRLRFVSIDRLILGGVCRLFPNMYGALAIVRPETVIRWHRAGFRSYWRRKSKCRCGRPAVTVEIRQLIRQVSVANPLWGAPRIHGELLKLGIDVGQTSVAKYMVQRRFLPRRDGGRSFVTMLMGLPRWTCSWCRQSRSGRSMACWLWGMAGSNFCGSELLHIQRPNGSPISSLRLAAGSKSRAT